ncbi:MAG: PPC domain-containing protein [Planctomycetaceae bacterium]|jgi:hypothetical protein|nr:PPC domain-containing protein [bacterium]MDC0273325.1 PPC domain-containing protein [Planctomycetaceae bacterium]MDG2391839.1 PPC domain-containing protein [Planctomycetaceae bacterium]
MRLFLVALLLVALLGVSLCSATVIAQLPAITKITPQGIAPGQTTSVKISGGNLENVKDFSVSIPALEIVKLTPEVEQKPNELSCDLTIPENTPNGIHSLRVLTDKGVSQPSLIVIDTLPVVAHTNQNKAPESAQSIPAVCTVEGHVDTLSKLYFRFPGKTNQPFSLEVQARRLGSPLDPIVRLFDPNGRELTWSDDEPGMQGDCWLQTTLPADGEYTIELADIRYQGGGNHRFRLRIGHFAVFTSAYPMIFQSPETADSSGEMSSADIILGEFVQETSVPKNLFMGMENNAATIWEYPKLATKIDRPVLKDSLWPVIGYSPHPQVLETEPNNTAEQSHRVELGHGINGRSDQPGDIDRFIFAAKKGQKFTFNAITRSAGSPTDLTLRILKPDGGQLAVAEDTGLTDGQVDVTFPADGDYTLEVRDLHKRGGKEFTWHVSVIETKPGFTLTAAEDTLNIPAGGTVAVQVNAQRKGYGGPIQVSAADLPAGVTAHSTIIGPGRNDAILTLKTSKDAKLDALDVVPRITGTADISGKPFVAVASLHDHLKASMNNAPWPSRNLIHSYAAAVTTPAPVNLRIEPAEVVFGQNLSAKFKVIAERTEGWDADIVLAINPAKNGLPGNITLAPQPIKKGSNEIELTVVANDKAALGDFTIALTGTIKKEKTTSVQPTPGLTIKLQAPMTIAVEPAGGNITKGGELKLKATISRNPALAAPVTLTAVNLPAGVTAEAVTIPADQTEVEFVLKAAADAANADVKNLQIKADAKVGDKTFSAITGNLSLKVE